MEERYKAVDLDGTLAHYNSFIDPLYIGAPIPKMVERVKKWLDNGDKVVIFTARVSKNKDNRNIKEVKKAIENWCEKYIGQKLPITNEKDFGIDTIWDDRAVRMKRNEGVIDRDFCDEEWTKCEGNIPQWVREEIKQTWKKARDSGNQLDSFKILERMVDRLGYGRITDNPSLIDEKDD